MNSSLIKEFLSKVISKVKAKEAHNLIEKELVDHLQELSLSYQQKQLSKEDAEKKAIQEMGNPYTLGESLNKVHQPKMDWFLIVLFLAIAAIGFVPLIYGEPRIINATSSFVIKQLIGYLISITVIIGIIKLDYRKLKNGWTFFYGIGLMLQLCTVLFGVTVNGSKSWLAIFGVGVDMTLVTLFFYFLAWTGIFSKMHVFNSWLKQGALVILFWLPISIYLIFPSYMVMLLYFLCLAVMFAFSNVHRKLAIKLVAVNLIASLCFISIMLVSSQGYFMDRLLGFLHPNSDPYGEGYMYLLLKDAFLQAGWFGHGLEQELTLHTIVNTHTDFAFPYLVSTLGWAFGIALCTVLLAFISRLSINAFKTKDRYGRLLVIGGATLFTVPTIYNILMGVGIVPIIGISIPFISYGVSIIVVYTVILGLILSVYRRKDMVVETW
ncbi:FtsW/RodA/SpoVE family cell cycle protein [Gracilibacillus dipsosauri]|uniref:FtsW/RodA/SpoVE family cell cycle protein n=1 Tax=Gracilibacillus dipsosauri TaxID=178340 RepID=A0A317L8C0_9BACI|nr:FtsW/RodA/SpoVE family cell cycle protein [Gracilibacillus dipsosauri]PWU70049.1 FtsW/RodA/SpoVE family cell cycle protein [Gracilibacillus dipsosauri]